MLTLGAPRKWVKWDEAGIDLLLSPLPEDVNAGFVRECVLLTDGPDGEPRLENDTPRYAGLVGEHCIHDWRGVLSAEGDPVPCEPEHIRQLMLIAPAQRFVFAEVRGISLHLAEEVSAAKKD